MIVGPDGAIRHIDTRPSFNNLDSGSTHRATNGSSRNFQSNYNNRKSSSRQMERSNSVDSFDIDNDDIEGDFPQKTSGSDTIVGGIPSIVESLSKSIRGMMDMSVHSGLGGGGSAPNEPSADRRAGLNRTLSQFHASTRSILTLEWDNSDENPCTRILRYLRLMAPHPDEKPLKKKIRIMTWVALVLDLLAAIVAITTYGGVTMCCGEPMMNVAGNFPWEKLITAVT